VKTFGTIRRDGQTWLLNVEPHVAVKLKRVFPRIPAATHGTIKISDTIDTCRELAWFLERYPLVGDGDVLEHLAARASAHRERETLVAQLLAGMREARPFDLALPPRAYQRVAADMCLASGGLLLADDLGLGKTCTGICVISEPAARPALVVTLTHLPKQWQAEIKKFAPQLRTHVLRDGPLYDLCNPPGRRAKKGQELLIRELPDVIITSYSKIAKWAEHLAPIVRSVVFDEAQELRRTESAKASAAKHVAESATYRLGLTATPIYNYGDEIFNVIDVVRPGELGTREEFLTEWCSYERIIDPKSFGTYIRDAGLMLRRTRADVGRELPELSRVPHQVDCDAAALASIETAATSLAQIILASSGNARGDAMRAAEELSMLVRQATGVAKAPYVAEFVRMLVESGEKVLVYGWHRDVYEIWNERLHDLKPAMYTGSESTAQKEEARRRFVEGETPVLLMSLRSGAGIDGLQHHARTIVFGELDWSPGVHDQCCGRLHRDGQGEPVVAYYLIADSGSDPIVADVLGVKSDQAAGIVDPNADLVEKLQNDGERIKRLAETYLSKRKAAAA
jgi:superfamily II DNA or RNA helicase